MGSIKMVMLKPPSKGGQKLKPLSACYNKYNRVVPYANVIGKLTPLEGVKKTRKRKK